VLNLQQQPVGIIKLKNELFGQPVRQDLVHQVVVWLRAGWRKGTAKQKSRAEVSGTGRKPLRQKGTGRARQGTRRAPHHRGGGRAFPKRPRDFSFHLNRKVVVAGFKAALSAKAAEGNLLVIDSALFWTNRGSTLHAHMRSTERGLRKTYVIDGDEGIDPMFKMASTYRRRMTVHRAKDANVYEIIRHQTLMITLSGLRCLESRLLRTPLAEPYDLEIGADKKLKTRPPPRRYVLLPHDHPLNQLQDALTDGSVLPTAEIDQKVEIGQ